FAGDFLGFVAAQGTGGGYIVFYAFSEMATCVIFASFLYRKDPTWTRVILAALVNLGVVFLGMNTLWFAMFYGADAMLAALPLRIGLNAAMTPVYVAILYFVLTRIGKLYRRYVTMRE
ncbi:MAG: hypothetical protein LBR00_07765, partial [Clostridiales Family XIII bacterium]|nr:hypothetical protein [Clostridiales Family XIII bacterium]